MSAEMQCHACGESVYEIDVRCSNCNVALSSTGAQRLVGSVVLDQYVITDILGRGGMSVVYQGKHKITGQEVALKVLPPDLAAHRDLKDRFLEEGKALAQLDHPNIVHLYNFGSDGDCLVLAMQYVRGITWERLIMDSGRVPWRKSAELTMQVSDALYYAHGRGIIHRDMKPSNVLIRDLDGAATVMDFGIAKVQSSTKLTATGQTMGTVRYMSPEQVRGKVVGVGTDIYSLAMTTYESLTGDTPFTGETHFEIMTKHLSEAPKRPSELGIDIPPAFEKVLMRAISKQPEDRQKDAKQLKEQLAAVLANPALENVGGTFRTEHLGVQPISDVNAMVDSFSGAVPIAKAKKQSSKSSARNLMLLAAVLVLLAAGTTLAITYDKGKASPTGKVEKEPAGAIAPAEPDGLKGLLNRELALGLSPFEDEVYLEDKLRVLSTEEWPALSVRELVMQARQQFLEIAKEAGWSPQHLAPLRVILVAQSDLCNPDLYGRGEVVAGCMTESAYIKPLQHSLYLVPTNAKKMPGRVAYWVGMASCLVEGSAGNCMELVETKLGHASR